MTKNYQAHEDPENRGTRPENHSHKVIIILRARRILGTMSSSIPLFPHFPYGKTEALRKEITPPRSHRADRADIQIKAVVPRPAL